MTKLDFSFKDIVENATDVIIVTKSFPLDPPGPEIVYVNKAFTKLTGYTQEDILGKNPRILQSNKTDKNTTKKIREGLEKQIPVRVTIKNFSKTSEEYWLDLSILPLKDPQGKVTHFVAIERDVTEQKNLERNLKVLSNTDSLTGLYNRRAFNSILKNEFSRYKRNNETYSMLMLDLDHFKSINDKYGHSIGDDVLKSITYTCKSNLRLHDKMARVGGEEFCILLPSTDKTIAWLIAEELRKHIANTPFSTKKGEISMTVSIGVSEVKMIDHDHDEIFRRADINLYEAKNKGRNTVCDGNSIKLS